MPVVLTKKERGIPMGEKTIFDKFTKQYQLSKTLRFELVPVGETERFIKEKGLLEKDEKRAEDYKEAKKLIDEYHKDFIERALQTFLFDTVKLQRHEELFMNPNRDTIEKDEFKKLKADLRESISLRFTKDNKEKYDPLDKKLLFREETDKETGEKRGNIIPAFYEQNKRKVLRNLQRQLPNLNLSNEQLDNKLKTVIEDFKSNFTYLRPFCENRKKILYTDMAIKNAIPYRLVDENLPIFSNNKKNYEKIKNALGENILQEIEKNLEITSIDDFFKLTNFNKTLTQTGIDQYNKAISGVKKKAIYSSKD